MNEQDFYIAVHATGFSDRYYALCRRFPLRDMPPCYYSKGIIMQILSEIRRSMSWDVRDDSFSAEHILARGTVHLGFVIQKEAVLDFWLWLEEAEQRIGSNYSVIAHEAARLAGKMLPDLPYPRPEFHSVDELRHILAECFNLADTLISILEQRT